MQQLVRRISVAVTASALLAAPAAAQVNFQGFTNGCFFLAIGAACTPETNNVARVDEIGPGPLRYSNTTGFNATSDAVSNLASLTNLGSFSLVSPGTFDYLDYDFVLRISFTVPTTTVPSSQLFTADVTGKIVRGQTGSVGVDFDNSAKPFSFDGGDFFVHVNDVAAMGIYGSANLTGSITVRPGEQAVAVPEPGTYALLATGVLGLGLVGRRRRSA